MKTQDLIRDASDRRARALGYTAETLSAAVDGAVTPQHIGDWITGKGFMTSSKAAKLLKVLGLELTQGE